MDEKARKTLIKLLAVADKFDPLYSDDNRRWMVGKTLAVIEGRVTGDSAIKSRTTEVVDKAKKLVAKHRDFKLALSISKKEAATERGLRSRRVQILYGMIAHEPDFVDPANEAQLLFVAKRRYRAIARFQFFINPNGRGYLRYDDTCPANRRWRVNVDADPLWEHIDATSDYPIRFKTPPTPPDILKALDTFFTAKTVACDGNIFDCATALSVVYMDSLLEAKTPKTLLEHLYARDPPMYLSIDHVHKLDKIADLADTVARSKYFIMDAGSTALFNKALIAQEDLQVGDHVYIWNHRLYKRLRPVGAWQGEHALLTDCGNREVQDDNGFRFMGHGMPRGGETGAVPRFYGNLLKELNTLLYRCFRLGGIFLFYKKSNDTAFPGKVTKETATATDINGTSQTVDFYFFDVDYKYNDFIRKPPKGKTVAQTSDRGFVAWHIAATREFGIHEKKVLADAKAQGIARFADGVRFTRFNPPGAPAEMFDSTEWAIPYPDNDGTELLHFLFQKKGAGVQPLLLEISELFAEPFAKADHPGPEILTTRPQVDLGSAYASFLTAQGGV
jgi:hypothetical protein